MREILHTLHQRVAATNAGGSRSDTLAPSQTHTRSSSAPRGPWTLRPPRARSMRSRETRQQRRPRRQSRQLRAGTELCLLRCVCALALLPTEGLQSDRNFTPHRAFEPVMRWHLQRSPVKRRVAETRAAWAARIPTCPTLFMYRRVITLAPVMFNPYACGRCKARPENVESPLDVSVPLRTVQ